MLLKLQTARNHLVLLPGLDGTGEMFEPIIGVLPVDFSASVVSYPRRCPLDYRGLLPYVREAVPWGASYVLVAESFSGPLALQFAQDRPEGLQAVVLVNSFIRNPVHPWLHWLEPHVQAGWFRRPPPAWLLRKFLVGEDCPTGLLDQLRNTIATVHPQVLSYRVKMVIGCDAAVPLRQCAKPLLYLHAHQDRIISLRGLAGIREIKRSFSVVTLDGPHLLLQRKPRESMGAIQKFLADLDRAAGVPAAVNWDKQRG